MRRVLNYLAFSCLVLSVSCANFNTTEDSHRDPSSSNADAIAKVAKACSVQEDSLSNLIEENAVENGAKKLNAGNGAAVFLMKDGRIVIASGLNKNTPENEKCQMDHLKLDEGKVINTFNIGRRLFMSVENEDKKRRVYVLTFLQDSGNDRPYQLHELKYTKSSSYASADSFKRVLMDVEGFKTRKAAAVVVKKDGNPYGNKRGIFKPWEWGANNEQISISTKGLARTISIRDERSKSEYVSAKKPAKDQEIITYLPRPKKTCVVEDKMSFFFGYFEFSISATTVMSCNG